MKIKVLIVEDEVLVAEDVASDLRTDGFEVTDIVISGMEALQSIEKNPPHIILMDINIKGDMDGVETAELINGKCLTPIIYVTSNMSSQFVSRAIKTCPHAFLTKPYNYRDLVIAIKLALDRHNEIVLQNEQRKQNEQKEINLDSIFVKHGDYHKKVLLNDVLYIEADGSYCKVYTKDCNYTFSFNLNHFQKQISTPQLKRVHRSYIVNLSNIDGFDKTTLLIKDKIIPVSAPFRNEVFKYFNRI